MNLRRFAQKCDFTKPLHALCFVLALRVLLTLWALPISARFPETDLEKRLALWPPAAWSSWLTRVFIEPWMRYDTEYYLATAARGPSVADGSASFHPLFPMLAMPLVKWGASPAWALTFISVLSATSLCVVAARYARLWQQDAKKHDKGSNSALPRWAIGFLFTGPMGWILLAPYTEATFLAFTVAALWAMRSERLWLAALLGALASLTRQQGIALALPLAWAWGSAWRCKRAPLHDALAVLGPLAGFLMYSLYRVFMLGDAPAARELQSGGISAVASWVRVLLVSPSSQLVVHGQHAAPPWVPLLASLRMILNGTASYNHLIDLIFGWVFVLAVLAFWKRYNDIEKLYCGAVLILATCFDTQPYMGFPRHAMLAFPLYMALAHRAILAPQWGRYTIEIGLVVNLLLAGAYFRHGWVP